MATATVESLTLDLYRRRLAVSERVNLTAQQMWNTIDPDALDVGWDRLSGELGMAVYSGQLASAKMSPYYIEEAADLQRFRMSTGLTAPESYAGVAEDGAGLVPLLYGAVTKAKTVTAAGLGAGAFEAGAAYLAAVIKSVIQEMGRQRDIVHMQAKGLTRYVRSISPGACSRCAILAGTYSAAVAFPRHPNCKCVAVPLAPGSKPTNLTKYDNPYGYFESLSKQEQDRIFTVSGAQAIRDGADIYQVVNVRRGASGISYSGAINSHTHMNSGRRLTPVRIGTKPNGEPLLAYTTSYGTTRFGRYGRREDDTRRSRTLRLMPEQIYVMAGNDPIRARVLLERYGYIY